MSTPSNLERAVMNIATGTGTVRERLRAGAVSTRETEPAPPMGEASLTPLQAAVSDALRARHPSQDLELAALEGHVLEAAEDLAAALASVDAPLNPVVADVLADYRGARAELDRYCSACARGEHCDEHPEGLNHAHDGAAA